MVLMTLDGVKELSLVELEARLSAILAEDGDERAEDSDALVPVI